MAGKTDEDQYVLSEEEISGRLGELLAALEANPRFRALVEGLAERVEGLAARVEGLAARLDRDSNGTIIYITVNNFDGDNVDKKYEQNINAPTQNASQGDNISIRNFAAMFAGSDGEATITRERWKKDMEDIAWKLTDRQDELARRLHDLFQWIANQSAEGDISLQQLAGTGADKAKSMFAEPEQRTEAGSRIKTVMEGVVAGSTHAVVHRFIEWLLPLLQHIA